ncbi:MAG: tetratricopeptide repeat protein [Alphaproteobacteria bacterium]|jgi:cytochrome c-type biogenesis protein CcmH
MTMLYILMAALTAGVCIKLVQVLAVPAAAGQTETARPPRRATREDRFLVAVVVLLLPVAALTIYLLTGRPDLRARQAIFDMTSDLQTRQAALLAQRPMAVLVGQNPDDIGAHLSLSEINRRIGRYDDEVKFLARAVALGLAAQDPLLRHYAVTLGQAQVRQNGGTVGDDALATFSFVRGLYPEDPLSRHFEALAVAQRGDPEQALILWRVLLSEGPSRAYWKDMVRKAMSDARSMPAADKP